MTASTTSSPGVLRPTPKGIRADWIQVTPALAAAMQQAAESSLYPVLLTGEPGRGKTCAMAAWFQRVPGRVGWFSAADLIRQIQTCRRDGEYYFPDSAYGCSEPHLWRTRVEQPDILFVDDLGVRSPTESQYEIIYELVERRGTRPTYYSTNLKPGELAKVFDARVASRLLRGTVIDVKGSDRRLKQTRVVTVE